MKATDLDKTLGYQHCTLKMRTAFFIYKSERKTKFGRPRHVQERKTNVILNK